MLTKATRNMEAYRAARMTASLAPVTCSGGSLSGFGTLSGLTFSSLGGSVDSEIEVISWI